MTQNQINTKRSFIAGLTASSVLLILYFVILSLANSFSHAVEQFNQMWYWILFLVAGFGLQVGLYFYIKESFRSKQIASPTAAVVTSGGVSTGSMIACCLHHLVDVLPLMGLATAATFLTQYQLWFIFLGILSNFVGIVIMLEIIQKHNLAGNFLNKILIYNMGQIKKIAIGSSLILLLVSFFLINNARAPITVSVGLDITEQHGTVGKLNLPSKIDSQGNVSFEVTLLDFNINDPLKFEIKMDTHAGSLDFDLTEVSIVKDDLGNQYRALEWRGSDPGGHHRSGILVFPKIDGQTKKIKLVIQDNYLRNFEWELLLK